MEKKFKGFSLAELLISLLIISIVLSAAIPTITKKAGQQRELIWRWTEQNHIAYTGVGTNQSVIIGLDQMPMEDTNLISLMQDNSAFVLVDEGNAATRDKVGKINISDIKYSDYGDKLVLLKRRIDGDSTNFLNSHISFFNMDNGAAATEAQYGGRLAMDSGNIALGIGTLQSMNKENAAGENTAIGHFALLRNGDGYRNTALGKKALSYNEAGSYNTSMGFASMFFLGNGIGTDEDKSDEVGSESNFENTAVGSEALYNLHKGSFNTAIGSQAFKFNKMGSWNTVIGQKAMFGSDYGSNNTVVGSFAFDSFKHGSNNLVLGNQACSYLQEGNDNICLGKETGNNNGLIKDNFGLYIGGHGDTIAPLISGHTKKIDNGAKSIAGSDLTYDQELIVNARKVKFQPYNGNFPIFEFETMYGADTDGDKHGYADYNPAAVKSRYGIAKFNLRDTGSHSDTLGGSSILLDINGYFPNKNTNKQLQIRAYNKYDTTLNTIKTYYDKFADIYINELLMIDFPRSDDQYTKFTGTNNEARVNIGLFESGDNTFASAGVNKKYRYKLGWALGLNDKLFVTYNPQTPDVNLAEDGFKVTTVKADGKAVPPSIFKIAQDDESDDINKGTVWDIKYIAENHLYMDKSQFDLGSAKVKIKSSSNDDSFIKFGSKMQLDAYDLKLDSLKNVTVPNSGGSSDSLSHILHSMANAISQLSSDIRKKNILGNNTAGIKEISQLEVKNFTYKDDKKKERHVGFIAQQVQKVLPEAVSKDEDGYLTIKKENIFFAIVNSVKELYKQLQDLTAKVTGLDKRITELEKQNKQLKEQNAAFEKRLEKLEKQQAAAVK